MGLPAAEAPGSAAGEDRDERHDGLLELERARELVLERAEPLDTEEVQLARAAGRTLAEDVISADAVPGFDNSAMDGFAVRAADLAMATDESPARLAIVGESRAGCPWEGSMGPGEAIRISTGAMMPEQADAVVRLEEADKQADELVTGVRIQSGRDVRRAGEDIVPGQTVIPRGARIGAAELGVLASVGIAGVRCLRRPRVAVVTTGEELIEPDEPMRAGGVRNSNAWSLPTLALAAGAELILRRRVSDDREATEAAIGEALNADVIVVTGGVSVGAHDHVKSALRGLGAIQVFGEWPSAPAARPGSAYGRTRSGAGAWCSACPVTPSARWSPSCSLSAQRCGRCREWSVSSTGSSRGSIRRASDCPTDLKS